MIKSQDELNTCNDGKRKSDVLIATIEKLEKTEEKLNTIIKDIKWIEEQADTSTQYDYDAEVILKNIVFDAQQALKEFRDDD